MLIDVYELQCPSCLYIVSLMNMTVLNRVNIGGIVEECSLS